jgi:hypothetical protein
VVSLDGACYFIGPRPISPFLLPIGAFPYVFSFSVFLFSLLFKYFKLFRILHNLKLGQFSSFEQILSLNKFKFKQFSSLNKFKFEQFSSLNKFKFEHFSSGTDFEFENIFEFEQIFEY